MQRGFTKLFNTIVTSTIWQEDDKTRIVWITMLAISDPYGIVSASIPGLASVSNVSVDAARVAVKNLLAPDAESRTKDFDGRRIEEIEGGWRILNYIKYRKMLSEAERAEYKAKWIRDRRRQMSTMSTDGDGTRQMSTRASASSSTSSSDWIKELSTDSTYSGIDVKREFGKMANWCKVHNVQPTRRRFVNWLNRADKPLSGPKATAVDYKRNYLPPAREPTEEELAEARKIAAEEKVKLKTQLNERKVQ
jgi:hypothetical protein